MLYSVVLNNGELHHRHIDHIHARQQDSDIELDMDGDSETAPDLDIESDMDEDSETTLNEESIGESPDIADDGPFLTASLPSIPHRSS